MKFLNVKTDDDLELSLPLLLPNDVKPTRSDLLSLKNKFLLESYGQEWIKLDNLIIILNFISHFLYFIEKIKRIWIYKVLIVILQ